MPIPAPQVEMLAKTNSAVLVALRADGSPVSFPVWYEFVDEVIRLNMTNDRKALAWVRNDPRVSLTVIDRDDMYTHVSLQGRITDIRHEDDTAGIDHLSFRYLGEPYAHREANRVALRMDVDSWFSWGALKDVTG